MRLKTILVLGSIVILSFLALFTFTSNTFLGSTSSPVIPCELESIEIRNADTSVINRSNKEEDRTKILPPAPHQYMSSSTENETETVQHSTKNETTVEALIRDEPSVKASTSNEVLPVNDYCNNTELFIKENQRRLAWIEKECKRNPKLSTMYEVFYFSKFKLGYCPVYKAASSNVLAQFCSHYFAERICKDKSKNGATLYRTSKTFKEPVPSGTEKRFVVVRDPLRRLLSAYRDKMEQLREISFKNPARDMMFHHRSIKWNINFHRDKSSQQAIDYAESMTEIKTPKEKPDLENPYLYPPYPTFKEFVAEVLAGWGNPHIVPASQYCGPCSSTKKFDFILKVETFGCDMRYMLQLSGDIHSTDPESNDERWATNKGPEGTTSLLLSYYSTLSDDQLEGLLRYYEDDCLLFEYPCQQLVDEIRTFKLSNPAHKYEYKNIWSGRTLS